MQLEKAKETKQDMERCRLLAQRIAEELAPATAAVLNAETPALEKALHRAGVDANPFTVAARQADLLVVEDPAWVEMPAQLPGQVLLVFTGSNVAEGWAEELARRGYGYVVQTCRGTGKSEGHWEPNVNERPDGRDTLQWLNDQPWACLLYTSPSPRDA